MARMQSDKGLNASLTIDLCDEGIRESISLLSDDEGPSDRRAEVLIVLSDDEGTSANMTQRRRKRKHDFGHDTKLASDTQLASALQDSWSSHRRQTAPGQTQLPKAKHSAPSRHPQRPVASPSGPSVARPPSNRSKSATPSVFVNRGMVATDSHGAKRASYYTTEGEERAYMARFEDAGSDFAYRYGDVWDRSTTGGVHPLDRWSSDFWR